MVDIREYIEVVPEETSDPKKNLQKPIEKPKEDLMQVNVQDTVSEDVILTEKEVVETTAAQEPLIEYMPQHEISEPPGIPAEEIREEFNTRYWQINIKLREWFIWNYI